jgi:hypothetical protein
MAKPKGKRRLRSYIYVSEYMVQKYFEQIQYFDGADKDTNMSFSLSLAGPSVDLNQKKKENATEAEKILKIEKFLENTSDLSYSRPQESGNDVEATGFVMETFTARKVIVPCRFSKLLRGMYFFTVWISDPDPAVYVEEDYVWRGTFLYLVGGWCDTNEYHSTLSGCSALQFIMNVAEGKNPLKIANQEPLGRGNDLHPVDKLKRLGALVSGQRKLTSLYRKRYVTNEQCYEYADKKRRVNDLVGYPIYIAEAS